ncbi:MAG: hypothetical protein WBB34_05080 [Xanthobacteraceae bacterium]
MYRKEPRNGAHRDSSPVDALAMLIEYALLESSELRLPLVTFLLKMARNAIQTEGGTSDPPLTTSPEGLEETQLCPLWMNLPASADEA